MVFKVNEIQNNEVTEFDVLKKTLSLVIKSLDMAVAENHEEGYFYYPLPNLGLAAQVISNLGDGKYMFLLQNATEKYNLSDRGIFDAALKAMRSRNDAIIEPMFETILRLTQDTMDEYEREAIRDMAQMPGCPLGFLTVLTNKEADFGAANILNKDILARYHEEKGDFYILPCSIHEVILLPFGEVGPERDPAELLDLVKSINATEISDQDFLADAVFKFTGKLELA